MFTGGGSDTNKLNIFVDNKREYSADVSIFEDVMQSKLNSTKNEQDCRSSLNELWTRYIINLTRVLKIGTLQENLNETCKLLLNVNILRKANN